MFFRGGRNNRAVRLVAGVVLIAFGGPALLTGILLVDLCGVALMLLGLCIVIVQGWGMWRERSDPYDLSKLWDKPPDLHLDVEPEEEKKERTLAYCHHCGASLPQAYGICPQCGRPM